MKLVKTFSVACVILLAVPYLLTAQVKSEVRYTADFSQFDLGFSRLDGYDLIRMKQASTMSELGKPVLPVKSVKIAIPRGTRAVKVNARSLSSTELLGDFYVMPGQPPIPVGVPGGILKQEPDKEIYASHLPYPKDLVILDQQSNLAGQQIVWVTVSPLQYIPAEKRLILHNRVEITVYCEQDIVSKNKYQERYYKFTETQRRLYDDMIKRMVVNPQNVHLNPAVGSPALPVPPGTFDHVIITSNALSSYFQPLVYWHNKKGIKDTVVTTEWIYANYTGPGDTTKIRQFIIDANTNWGTMYFLMGGENSTVPYARRFYYDQHNVPSDHYYSDFDDDWTHEVFVGRASVANQTQANTFINKVLKYEKDPPLVNYPIDALLIGMDLDASTYGELLMETIAGYLPGYFNIHKVYDSHGGNHRDSVLAYLNAGQNLVAHADHCNQTSMGMGWINHWWDINRTNVDNLTNNNEPCIVTSIGCEPNAFDYSDCIAEHFVIKNPNQAGIAFVGNTRHGWGYVGDPASLSGQLVRDWWKGIFQESQDDLGQAIVYTKHQFPASSGVRGHCEWTFNLLGEPAMPIWTNTPDSLLVTHNPLVPPVSGSFTITVKDNDGVTPIDSALVCCWIPNQTPGMYAKGYTNASGQAILPVSPTTPGDTMYVTATKHNYLPREGYAMVSSSGVPHVIYLKHLITDPSPDGNNDGQVNPGEVIEMPLWVKNTGTDTAFSVVGTLSSNDPFITFTDSAKTFGNIPNGDSVYTGSNGYNFNVSTSCEDGHEIEFTLTCQDYYAFNWISQFSIIVHAPVITLQHDTIFGGNNDGVLNPGETADLVITIENEGSQTAENTIANLLTSSSYITIHSGTSNYGTLAQGDTANNVGNPFTLEASLSTPPETSVDFLMPVFAGACVDTDTVYFSLTIGQLGIEEDIGAGIPVQTMLTKVYPNPFNKIVEIRYQLTEELINNQNSVISMKIYDCSGRLVKQFNNLTIQPFNHIIWDGLDNAGHTIANGVYFVRFVAGDYEKIKKAILLK